MRCRFILRQETLGTQMDVRVYRPFFPDSYIAYRGQIDKSFVDVNFYIEVPLGSFINQAKINVLMCNYEYLIYGPVAKETIELLRKMHIIICKVKKAVEYCEMLKLKHGLTFDIIYTKHTTIINPCKGKRNKTKWLHAAGISPWKQTDAILGAWIKHPEWPQLIVTCRSRCKENIASIDISNAKNITMLDFVEDLNLLQYQTFNHICPSIVEGFGHYINEARAHGAFIVTSNYPPMNELITKSSGVLIDCTTLMAKPKTPDINLCIISVDYIERSMTKIFKMDEEKKIKLAKKAHEQYKADTEFFNNKMKQLIKKLELLNS